jgi:GTP pyrophosphokinase
MQRKNIGFEQLSDIMAFRIVVPDVAACYQTLGVLHSTYSMVPGRFKDYISTPKPNNYRSLHTGVIGPERQRIEVQIRTREMHEVSELGVAAHWRWKQEAPQLDGRQYRWLRELLDILEHAAGPEEFLEHTKLEMFQDQVFCFTATRWRSSPRATRRRPPPGSASSSRAKPGPASAVSSAPSSGRSISSSAARS